MKAWHPHLAIILIEMSVEKCEKCVEVFTVGSSLSICHKPLNGERFSSYR